MKKFYRSKTNIRLAGICGGLGEYFETDPLLWRLLLVIFNFLLQFLFFVFI